MDADTISKAELIVFLEDFQSNGHQSLGVFVAALIGFLKGNEEITDPNPDNS